VVLVEEVRRAVAGLLWPRSFDAAEGRRWQGSRTFGNVNREIGAPFDIAPETSSRITPGDVGSVVWIRTSARCRYA
jgi:hypothetical protein